MPDTIETLEDWNTRLGYCGCCGMPDCPTPEIEIENKEAFFAIDCYFFINAFLDGFDCNMQYARWKNLDRSCNYSNSFSTDYSDRTTSFSTSRSSNENWTKEMVTTEGGRICRQHITSNSSETSTTTTTYDDPPDEGAILSQVYTASSTYDSDTPPVVCTSSTTTTYEGLPAVTTPGTACPSSACNFSNPVGSGSTITYSETAGTQTWSATDTYSNRWTVGDLQSEVDIVMADATWTPGGTYLAGRSIVYTLCPVDPDADPVVYEPALDCPEAETETKGRYRFRIPSDHTGTTFSLEWDEVFFPDGYAEEGYSGDAPTVTAKSYTWSGPGNAEDPDDASWFSPWSTEVTVPAGIVGVVEIRNFRFTCRGNGPYGNKPQYSGSTYIPPA
jgi:hypothetical protein